MTPRSESRGAELLPFGIASTALALLMAATVAFSWPTNVLSDQTRQGRLIQSNLLLTVPQSWSFFTRSPQSPSYVAYAESKSGQWQPLGTLPQSTSMNAYGLSRNQRSQSTELAIIASKVDLDRCDDYLTRCLEKASTASPQTVKNTTNTQNFCGRLQLIVQKPVKWSYRHSVPELIRGEAFANTRVECGRSS